MPRGKVLYHDQPEIRGEVWRELVEFPNYAVSDHGRVMNTVTDQLKKPSINQQGIAMVNLSVNKLQNVRSIAVLVAMVFLQDDTLPDHFDTPMQLDGDRANCRVDNLCWRPRWYAMRYHKQFTTDSENIPRIREPIVESTTEEQFPDSWAASMYYGLLDRDVSLSLRNNEPTPVVPHWFYYLEA